MSKRRWSGRVYLGRDKDGKQLTQWVGRFDTKRERDEAVALARMELKKGGRLDLPTCDAYVDRYLEEYGRTNKGSSYDTQRQRLQRFRQDFMGRSLNVFRAEAKDWAADVPPGCVQAVVTLYNHAIDEDDLPLERNPFRKLGRRTKGRADQPPPTEEEFQKLLDSCSALGHYAPKMRSLLLFAAFTLMRPSELYELEWADIDFDRMRIHKQRRLYRGTVDEPKTGKKLIALTAPARDAILGLPRESRLVFTSKTGKRLSQATVAGYWSQVLARAGLDFAPYLATKHYGVHMMWARMGMSARAIAAQAGWSVGTVDAMLGVYGHAEVDALEEVDRAFAENVVPLREAREEAS